MTAIVPSATRIDPALDQDWEIRGWSCLRWQRQRAAGRGQIGGNHMRAAVLNEQPGPLEIEDISHRRSWPRRGADPDEGRGAVPQRPALHGGHVPHQACRPCSATSRPAWWRRWARASPTCRPATTSSAACRSSAASAGSASAATRTGAPTRRPHPGTRTHKPRLSRGDGERGRPVRPPRRLRRADARPPERGREDHPGHAARPGRADRLWRHHRHGRRVPHRQGRAGQPGVRDRSRRHRPQRHPGGPHRRRRPGDRGRRVRREARDGPPARRHRPRQRQRGRRRRRRR